MRIAYAGLLVLAASSVAASEDLSVGPPATAEVAPARDPSEITAASRSQPEGKTLVPVYRPVCGGPMPTAQTYREVSVAEAAAPPKCHQRAERTSAKPSVRPER